jgi:CDP-6-deoxy-D-xylo-4-hexulose-3-dehydrase
MDKIIKSQITYGKNVYGSEEINAVLKRIKQTTQMSTNVKTFEKKIAKKFNKKYGIMVNSGSSAIHLGLKILNLKKNSEVIVPCLNFGTAISSLTFCDLKPIFVDINIKTLQIDENLIEKKINSKTKAIMVPNLIGNIPNWKRIKKIATKHNLKIIEDSADTLGAKIDKKSTGFYSDMSITSFYGSHIISCAGNGGILMVNNKQHYKKGLILRSWGRLSSTLKNSEDINKRLNIRLMGVNYDRKFVFSEQGFNFEPSELGATFGLQQLLKFNKFQKIRNKNFNFHHKFFSGLKKYFIPVEINKNIITNFLAYPVILKSKNKFNRKKLQVYLEKNNIQTRPIFSGNILRHPGFKNLINKKNKLNSFPAADYIMKNGILIGCHQGLKKNQLEYIHKKILKFINSHNE